MSDLRTIETESIRAFVQSAADEGYLSGRVLDYGCGKQPYRDIVEAAGGEYEGYDRVNFPANVSGEDIGVAPIVGVHLHYNSLPATESTWTSSSYDAILCTQVLQYAADPAGELYELRRCINGHLVMTYPTNWPEVEPEDLHRFTKAGMERLLTEAGFTIIRHESRATVKMVGWGSDPRGWAEEIALGYGCIARA